MTLKNVSSTMQVLGLISLFAASGLAAQADTAIYSDTTNYSGSALTNTGAASIAGVLTTRMLVDDLNFDPSAGGLSLTQFSFPVANLNTAAVTARPRVRFYANDNGGVPGTYLGGFSFTAFSIPVGVSEYFTTLTPGQLVLPAAIPGSPTETVWAGITYDNSGATRTTAAQLNKLGAGIFDPPTIGSSAATAFETTAADTGLENDPAGSLFTLTGANANFGWELRANTTPEPGAVALFVGLGISSLTVLRRRKVSGK